MKNLNFPIKLNFNISTLANDFTAKDTHGQTVAYVKQKLFKLKEDITVYENENKNTINYKIKADKWIDFSTAYSITNNKGKEIGKLARKGWASMWKAHYELIDQFQRPQYHIREESVLIRFLDSLLGQIPILGLLTGYFFHASYLVTNDVGEVFVKLKKEPSLFGNKFEIIKLKEMDNDDDERIILGLMMMILLEKRRG